MADLTLTPSWDGVYQLETTDPVEGGPEGIDNRQAGNLGNRTEYLKERADAVDAAQGTDDTLQDRLDRMEATQDTTEAFADVYLSTVCI